MKLTRLTAVVVGVFFILASVTSTTFAQAPLEQDEPDALMTVTPDAVYPTPIMPGEANGYIFTRTPRFYFTRHADALMYEIQVLNWFTDTPVYTFKDPGNCTQNYCWIQIPAKLKNYSFEVITGGMYYWYVRAKTISGWLDFTSDSGPFLVLSRGFTSTFDANTNKWLPIKSTWTRTAAGKYKTMGEPGFYSNTMHIERFLDHFVYEVKMKRKSEGTSHNYLMFYGRPDPIGLDYTWKKGIAFGYTNYEMWRVWKMNGLAGITIVQDNTYSPYINEFGWNTLTVWTDNPYIHMWINGIYVGWVTNDIDTDGYVGVGMYREGIEDSPLLVDYAKLYYSAISPYAIPEAK